MIGVNAPKKYPRKPYLARESSSNKEETSSVFTNAEDFQDYSRIRWGKKGDN